MTTELIANGCWLKTIDQLDKYLPTFFSPNLAETPIRTIPIIKGIKCSVIEW